MKTVRLISLALVAASAIAFGQGGPPQGRGGPGGPGGPGGDVASPTRLLSREDVQKDLTLTDDQKTKIEEVTKSMRPSRGPGGGGPGGDDGGPPMGEGGPPPGGDGQMGPGGGGPPGGGSQDDFMKQMEARQKKATEAIKKILTTDQWTRLKGIMVQLSGYTAVTDSEIATDVKLTDAQKAKIKTLTSKLQEANRSLFEKAMNGEIERDEIRGLIKKNSETLKTEIGKLLTDDQKAKLHAMEGEPFKATDQEPTRG